MYPAGIAGLAVSRVDVGDGVAVRVVQGGPSGGSIVLLVHGWGGCVYSFAELIPALTAAGHRVVAFDLPGHGLSDKPTEARHYTTDALCRVVRSVADRLALGEFALIGHSMGGSLGLQLAVDGEPALRRLVLINSVGLGRIPVLGPVKLLSPPVVDRWMPGLLTRRVVRGILRGAFGTSARPTARDVDEYWAPTRYPELAAACRACIHHVNWRPQSRSRLRSLDLPVLVICGGRDRVVARTAVRARYIPGARVLAIATGGHLVMQECAGETNPAIVDFLRAT